MTRAERCITKWEKEFAKHEKRYKTIDVWHVRQESMVGMTLCQKAISDLKRLTK